MNVDTRGARERLGQWGRFFRRWRARLHPLAIVLAAPLVLVACGKLEWPESVFTLAPGPLPSWCRAHERLCDEAERIDIAFYQGRVEFEVQAKAGGRTIVQGIRDDVYWKAGASMIDYPRAIKVRVGDRYDFYVLDRMAPVMRLVDEASVRRTFDLDRLPDEIALDTSAGLELPSLDAPFNHCKTRPAERVQLTPRAVCLIEVLSSRCNVADDCLVSCLADTLAREAGGGCWHVCFGAENDLSTWTPPPGLGDCPPDREPR